MDYREKYEQWISDLKEDSPLKKELLEITDDEEIKERFHSDLSFGTAGLRGKLGAGTTRMNVLTVGKATYGIALYIKNSNASDRGVVISRDPRHMSEEFCHLAAGIMASMGIKTYVFDDIRSTPQLAYMIRRIGAVCGINITASHNPKEYNGYKVYWEDGCQVSAEIADGMAEFIQKVDMWNDIPHFDYDALIKEGKIEILSRDYDRDYLDRIEALALHHGEELDLDIPIIYTPLNGCGAGPFTEMLKDRGFTNWLMVPEQSNPDPDFATVGYPNPEDPAAFALSEKYGRERGAELLLATDPDADRFAIQVKDSQGNYIPLNGNQTGYILVNYILESLDKMGKLPQKGAMVKSIVTSDLSAVICESYGVKMFETLTGFKNICGKIPYLKEHGYTYLLGYEESIGYAPCEDIRDKDGISAGMLIAEAAAYYRKEGRSLWDVLRDIYKGYGYRSEIGESIVLEGLPGKERIGRMMSWLRENMPRNIRGIKVTDIIDYLNGWEDIPPQNAMRVYLENGCWFAVRPSGTEPKIKLYFYGKGASNDVACKVNEAIRDEILELLHAVE